jgi:hypothetical protein
MALHNSMIYNYFIKKRGRVFIDCPKRGKAMGDKALVLLCTGYPKGYPPFQWKDEVWLNVLWSEENFP